MLKKKIISADFIQADIRLLLQVVTRSFWCARRLRLENGGSGSLNAPASNDISFLITPDGQNGRRLTFVRRIELQMLSIGIDSIRFAAARSRSSANEANFCRDSSWEQERRGRTLHTNPRAKKSSLVLMVICSQRVPGDCRLDRRANSEFPKLFCHFC